MQTGKILTWGTAIGVGLGVAFELATHVFVHYTIPGAAFASSLAQGVAPILNGLGITTTFAEAANATASTAIDALPDLIPQ